MMMDLYALPHDVPGHAEAMALASPYEQAETLEAALADEIKDQRFIPYIQVHEFEHCCWLPRKSLQNGLSEGKDRLLCCLPSAISLPRQS